MKCDEKIKNHKYTNHGQTFKKYVKTITIFDYWPLKMVIINAIETTTFIFIHDLYFVLYKWCKRCISI